VEKLGFVVIVVSVLLALPLVDSQVHPLDFEEHGSAILDPYDVCVWRFEALEGDRLVGKVTAYSMPIQMYIFRDGDFEYPREFQVGDAIFNHYGMHGEFDFTSSEEIDWLLVLINDNNITQNTEFECTSYDPPVRELIKASPILVPLGLVFVLLIVGPIIYYRRKTS